MVIWHLWVQPGARGHGWARRLLEAASQHARCASPGGNEEPVRVAAEVLLVNAKALAFWRHVLPGGTEEQADDYVRISAVAPGA